MPSCSLTARRARDVLTCRFDRAFPSQTWDPGPDLANGATLVPPELFDSGSHLPTAYCHAPRVIQTKSLCNCSIDQLKRTDTLARSRHGFLMRCLRIGEQMH